MFRFLRVAALLLVAAVGGRLSAQVVTLASGAYQNPTTFSNTYLGQSITTPSSGSWTNLQFAFLGGNGSPASSSGDLYLYSSATLEYVGTLSPSSPAFLAKSTGIVNGYWVFDSSVVLSPNTTYYFFGQNALPTASIQLSNTYAGGMVFIQTGPTGTYAGQQGFDAAFTVQATAAAVPEPSTYAALLCGGAMLLAFRRRLFRRAS